MFWLDGQDASVPGFRFVLDRAVLTGKLVQLSDGTWGIKDGMIGAVTTPSDMLDGFRQLGFCGNMCQDYASVKLYLDTYRDTLSNTDAILPSVACDGLSLGMSFTADQAMATVKDVVDVDPPVVCPVPKNPAAPRQGCLCPDGGSTVVCPTAGA